MKDVVNERNEKFFKLLEKICEDLNVPDGKNVIKKYFNKNVK